MRFKADFFFKAYFEKSEQEPFSICTGILSDSEFCKEKRFSNGEILLGRVLDVVETLWRYLTLLSCHWDESKTSLKVTLNGVCGRDVSHDHPICTNLAMHVCFLQGFYLPGQFSRTHPSNDKVKSLLFGYCTTHWSLLLTSPFLIFFHHFLILLLFSEKHNSVNLLNC